MWKEKNMDLSNENVIHVKKNGIQFLQFRRLLEYQDILIEKRREEIEYDRTHPLEEYTQEEINKMVEEDERERRELEEEERQFREQQRKRTGLSIRTGTGQKKADRATKK